jgi:Putative amidase domain
MMLIRKWLRAPVVVGRAAVVVAVAGGIALFPAVAHADGSAYEVYNTAGEGLWLHPDTPSLTSSLSDLMPDGTEFDVSCWANGDNVNGDVVWDYGTNASTGNTGYAADYYLDTPVSVGQEAQQLSALGIPECGSSTTAPSTDSAPAQSQTSSSGWYDRQAAADWATSNEGHAPLIQNEGDCTWFASQAAWAGGLPQSDTWEQYSPNGILGSDYESMIKALVHGGYSPTDPVNPTLTATNADQFVNYLVDNGFAQKIPIDWSDNTASGAQLGDFIAYDWDGGADGSIDHVAVVTGYAKDTNYPTVTQHSPAQLNRYWSWSIKDNSWIQYGTDYQPSPGSSNGPPQAYLIHIVY